MPSIEIICVGQPEPSDFHTKPFAVEAEPELLSHRSPKPLFQADFDQLRGCIYHLGDPELKDPASNRGCYTAGALLTEWWDVIHFKPEFVPHVDCLLQTLLLASPEGRLIFTSDYQFGPSVRRYQRPLTLRTFWKRHDAMKLHTNALYQLINGRPS